MNLKSHGTKQRFAFNILLLKLTQYTHKNVLAHGLSGAALKVSTSAAPECRSPGLGARSSDWKHHETKAFSSL